MKRRLSVEDATLGIQRKKGFFLSSLFKINLALNFIGATSCAAERFLITPIHHITPCVYIKCFFRFRTSIWS